MPREARPVIQTLQKETPGTLSVCSGGPVTSLDVIHQSQGAGPPAGFDPGKLQANAMWLARHH